MWLSFPRRVPIPATILFALGVVVLQQFEHTSVAFSLLFFSFTVICAITFNTAGGLRTPTGAYVFFFATLTVIAAVTLRALVGEAADTNLEEPLLTMTIYTVGSMLLLATVVLTRRFTTGARGLGTMLGWKHVNMRFSAVGCVTMGSLIFLANMFGGVLPSLVGSALNQLNVFLPLGLILATVDTVERSQGRRSFNIVSFVAFFISFLIGVGSFSKQAVFSPFVAWTIGAIYARLRLRPIHFVVAGLSIVLLWSVLTPISQVGRSRTEGLDFTERLELAYTLGLDLKQTREIMDQGYEATTNGQLHHGYFNEDLGLGDRLAMFQFDDSLIAWTARNETVGYAPMAYYLENWVPHVLDKDKLAGSVAYNGNFYAHRVGGYLASSDEGTSISFGVLGEAYAIGGWQGVLLLTPAIWIGLFLTTELVAGSLDFGPWALLPILLFAHLAPESLISGLMWYMWYGNIGLAIAITFCVYVAPLLGSVFGTALSRGSADAVQPLAPRPAAIPGRA